MVVIVATLGKRVKSCHRCTSFDVGDPDRCNLLEPNGEADILDGLAVDGVDVQAKELFLRLAVPRNAGEVPGRINNTIFVHGQGPAATLEQVLTLDGHISITTRILRLLDVYYKYQFLARSRLARLRQMERYDSTRDRVLSMSAKEIFGKIGMTLDSPSSRATAPARTGASKTPAFRRPRMLRQTNGKIKPWKEAVRGISQYIGEKQGYRLPGTNKKPPG